MKNNFFYNFSLGNINAKPSNNSETLSQILYGEKFKVLKNNRTFDSTTKKNNKETKSNKCFINIHKPYYGQKYP